MDPYVDDEIKRKKRKNDPEDINNLLSTFKSAIMSLSESAIEEFKVGELKRVLIEGKKGILIIQRNGKDIKLVNVENNESLGKFFCENCGYKLKKDQKFCPWCGKKV
ncbi:MAG: roadblock/LC7 domain-containing protein [Promethearchaeota archaeon]